MADSNPPPTEASFEDLLASVLEDPNAVSTINASDEQLMELQRALNPYARIAGPQPKPGQVRAVATSFTNLREDYIRRFTMTGIIGFVFRMLREYDPPAEQRRWTPAIRKKGQAKQVTTPFTVAELQDRALALTELAALVKEAEAELETATELANKFNQDEMVFSESEMRASAAWMAEQTKGAAEQSKEGHDAEQTKGAAEQSKEGLSAEEAERKRMINHKMEEFQRHMVAVEHAKDKLSGLRYTTTLEMRNMGIESDLRIQATEEQAMKFVHSRQVIQESPDRYKHLLPRGQQEMPADQAKNIIKSFLNNYFEFDPDAHVRSAHDEAVIAVERKNIEGLPDQVWCDVHDHARLPIQVLLREAPPETTVQADAAPLKYIGEATTNGQHRYNTVCHLLTDPLLAKHTKHILQTPESTERFHRMLLPKVAKEVVPVVPPQDTFHRANYYMEVNMAALREATNTLYHDKPDMDFALAVMDYFEGTPAKVKELGEAFRDQYQDQLVSDIKVLEFGGWTLLGDFAANREKVDIFNRHTDVLKRILDRHEQDKKYGELLMRKRVKKAKAANIQKDGPDAPGLSKYKQDNPMAGMEEALSPEERRRLERTQGNLKAARELEFFEAQEAIVKELEAQAKLRALTPNEQYKLKEALEHMEKAREMLDVPEDALQVDVWNMNPGKGTVTKSKFYTEAQAPDADPKAVAGEEYYPEGSRAALRKARAEGKDQPDLAPFAQDYLQKELERERAAKPAPQGAAAASPPAQKAVELAPAEIDAALAESQTQA